MNHCEICAPEHERRAGCRCIEHLLVDGPHHEHLVVDNRRPLTEQQAVEVLLGLPPDVQRRNELERQFEILRAALADGRLTVWHFYERPFEAHHRTITFTFRDEP